MKIKSEHKNTVYVGDIHGEFERLGFDIYNRYELEDTLIICLGDIGMGFNKNGYYDMELGKIQKKLEQKNNTIVFFRGNHDDPSWFNGKSNWNNIYFADDYSVINQNNTKSLIVGGGLSVDRTYRISSMMTNNINDIYWENELIKLTDENINFLNKQKDISIILTHMAPTGTYPYLKNGIEYWVERDKEIINDDNSQRDILKEVFTILQRNGNNITEWYYGHYHQDHFEIINNVKYRCIKSNKFYYKQK